MEELWSIRGTVCIRLDDCKVILQVQQLILFSDIRQACGSLPRYEKLLLQRLRALQLRPLRSGKL